ncbi:MAG: DNA polymerase IV [Chloroflexi bacterium]|nr:DNA polymerase IV [Chloroflexota bacterium]
MSQRTIMHIDLDAFFVSVEQASNPELRGKPVVVGGKPDRRGVVATASYEARAFGLHSGMPLATALRLCPQAIFIEGNYQRYAEVSKKFMAILADFSPFLEPTGLDEAYLDATGFESLHGSIRQMALKIKQRVKDELGIVASVGIATCKVVAKAASDESKPDGLIEVPPGGESAFLAPLAIRKLPGVGKKTEQVLTGLGIRTIGQLARMPLPALKSRFGVFGDMLYRHANGTDDSPVTSPAEAKSISRETTFEEDTRDNVLLSATLRYLTERVGADLRELRKQAKCVSIKVRYADFTTITRQCTLPQLTDVDQTVFQTGNELLQKAVTADRRAIRLIGIGVSSLSEPGKQLSLMNSAEQRLERLNRATDRIRDKYGFTAIQTGRTIRLR